MKSIKGYTVLVCFIILSSFTASVFADSYTYDANGNMLQDTGKNQCYVYNQANQLKEVNNCGSQKIASYYYDYTGRRIKTVEYNGSSNITTYYPFSDFETVVGGPNSGNTTYYYANGERVARKDPNGSMHYVSGDHLGSTSVVTDAAGNLEEKTRYKPFGDTLSHVGTNLAKYLYTGQEKDTETGLYYYGARYYNPGLMRFTSPDQTIPDMYNPQTLNRYSYVNNNPLKYTDETGNCPLLVVGAVIVGGGFVVGFATSAIMQYMETGSVDVGTAAEAGVGGAVGAAVATVAVMSGGGTILAGGVGSAAAQSTYNIINGQDPMANTGEAFAFGSTYSAQMGGTLPEMGGKSTQYPVIEEYARDPYRSVGNELTSPSQLAEGGDYIFAEPKQGKFVFNERSAMPEGHTSHPDLTGGKPVYSAGHIKVSNGNYKVYPATGHYQVGQSTSVRPAAYLEQIGVDSSKIQQCSIDDYYKGN